MKPARTAGCVATAALALSLAACGGGGTKDTGAPGTAAATTAAAPRTTAAGPADAGKQDAAAPAGGALTPPGTRLATGRPATVGWVPLSKDTGLGAHRGIRLEVTVESISKGTIADFKNIDLDAGERRSTPYYVKVRVKALAAATGLTSEDDPDVVFDAIDDRGQKQAGITFLGTFDRCEDKDPPKPFAKGASYESCLTYLMPGGGSIRTVQWNNGPSAADQVTPYFEKPIVWAQG
jgi:hypothetical protein